MSIWGTIWSAADDHTDDCARWVTVSDHVRQLGDGECTCHLRDAPILYQGSHVLPADTHEHGGYVGLAEVPSFITCDGRDDGPDDGVTPWPYLRLSVGQEDAVLDEQQAVAMHQALGEWLAARGAPVVSAAP